MEGLGCNAEMAGGGQGVALMRLIPEHPFQPVLGELGKADHFSYLAEVLFPFKEFGAVYPREEVNSLDG